ncbi:Alpha-amylase type A isozyme [Colletotrichum asianum]
MSGSIQNIMNDFNSILGLAGIEQFSATLESVLIVGILNNTVQYMAVTLDSTTLQTKPAWSLLDTLPASPSGTNTTALFSYNGIFFVAVGPNVWQKTPKPPSDLSLAKAAVDNWLQMFYPGWQLLGFCLPAGDSLCLAPYNNVASDGTTIYSTLIKLTSDGTLT